MRIVRSVSFAFLVYAASAVRAGSQTVTEPDIVVVRSGNLQLRALIWRPQGSGPFAAVSFSHGRGSTPESASRPSAISVLGPLSLPDMVMRLMETDHLDDAVAGLAFLRALPDVDAHRVAVAGQSFGGSLTLLLAERDSTLKAAINFGGAAASWPGSSRLRERLIAAAGRLTVPVFFIYAANDFSVAPGEVLDAEMARHGKVHRLKLFPAHGRTPDDGHNFVSGAIARWEHDVFAFLDEHVRR